MSTESNPKIDLYLKEGCGRCALGGTSQCKVHNWNEELKLLRKVVLDCGLKEELKWGVPCYTVNGSNVAIVSAFKEYCALSFFKGALLSDSHQILDKPGKSSQAGRLVRFTNAEQILNLTPTLKTYLAEAMEVEHQGLQVDFKQQPEPIPEELQIALSQNSKLRQAFDKLTPGRQRSYIIYFSQPKQSKTRVGRIEKYASQILAGKGFNDW